MQTDVAALAVTFADRGSSSPDDDNGEPPEPEAEPPADEPRRRRRRLSRLLGGAFLDGPTDNRYSNLWLGACGQGG